MKYIVSKGKNFMVVYYNDEKKIESMLKNIQLKKLISNFNHNFSFKSINPDSNQLFSLILSEDNGSVSSSQNNLTIEFGSHISSLIKGDFWVYIISTINQKLYPSISFEINELTGLPRNKI